MKINYSLLLYLVCIPLGYDAFWSADGDLSVLRTVCFIMALLITICGGFLNAKHHMKYRSVLWIFFVNILLILGYIISNGGTGDASFFGDNQALGFFLASAGLNMQWTYLSHLDLSLFSSDFTFLFIGMCCSFLFPSVGFLVGRCWGKRSNNAVK
ncbi:hypothetical protein IW15_20250 [Chryseobacterium soli]|uniref:Uncharacterized protein n=1 Tax=Chryseobacterium soli TaxID=445961 RepID=A0A086A101_9FLAO|nr:hypothetical protein [Chryseobacterium soli]KFF10365.1 hypothetical protein IW15_20250 [Chryseobacterium soli]